jgi:DNA-binding SARP family transcriptional activator
LVAFLALQRRPLLRQYVAGALWLNSTQQHANASLRTALWRVHQHDCQILLSTRTHLRLSPWVVVDVAEMTTRALRLIDFAEGCEGPDLDAAWLSGELLPDWYDDWVLIERERLRQLRLQALDALCERLIRAGRNSEAVQAGFAAVREDPLRESGRRNLIQAHLAQGNKVEALRQEAAYRRLLMDELGVQPSQVMERLLKDSITA